MSSSDEFNRAEAFLIFLGVIICVFLLIGGCNYFARGIQNNDHAKILRDQVKVHRDQVVKVECIRAGKSIIDGNCVKIAP